MDAAPLRYESNDEDSGRWLDFPFRQGDIVISTRSKSGTTWMQMICALLVFQTSKLPHALGDLSPWLDHKIEPLDEVVDRLEAQPHRRFIKTHTPLDGVVLDPRATYVVVARDPRDMYISLYHQGNNMDRDAIRRMLGQPALIEPEKPTVRRPLEEALERWIDSDADPRQSMDSIRGVFHHVSDAWERRQCASPDQPTVILVHYDDLLTDLEGQMRRLADQFGITVPDDRWPDLVEAATFSAMKSRADSLAPGRGSVLKDVGAFFRQGRSGGWRDLMTDAQVRHYEQRAAGLAPAEVVAWLHP
ncbi:MAG: sulfotransferase domain-containing protein [Nocardioidaceae bacterium]